MAWTAGLFWRFQTILTTTGSVAGTTLVNSVLGFAYWWLAVRLFSPQSTGLAVAALSAMALIGRLAVLGLATSIVGALPKHSGSNAGLIFAAMVVTGATATLLGAGFALLAPGLIGLGASPELVALFAVGVLLTTIGTFVDTILIGVLKGSIQLLRNFLFAGIKLVLIAFAKTWWGDSEGVVISTWVIGDLISLIVIAALLVSRGHILSVPDPEWRSILDLGRNAIGHHVLNLARLAPGLVSPVLVAALLSPEANAEFYVVMLIAGSLQIIASASTFSLYAVAVHEPEHLDHQVRFTIGLSAAGVTVGLILIWMLSDPLLSLFGWGGSDKDRYLMLLLAVAAYPMIVKDHWIVLRRIRQDVRWAAGATTAGAALEIILAGAGAAMGGLLGLAAAWLVAQLIQAALMGSSVYHAAFRTATGAAGRRGTAG